MNSTETYWDINGVSLQTYAWNVSTWGGDLNAPPPLRGDDLTIPYRPGQVFQARRPDGRSMSFNMWVQGSDSDGNIPSSASMRAEFEKNFKALRALFWNQGKPVTLTRRWKNYGSNTVQVASAQAIFANGLAPAMTGAQRATFTVEMFLPDPFFYGPDVNINFVSGATTTVTQTILGDYETTNILLLFNGTRNNFRMTNNSEGVYVNVSQSLSSGQTIRLDIDNWQARKNHLTDNTNVVASVSSLGHPFWFVLRPGSQELVLSSSTGTGSATLTYRPRWI